MSPILVRPVREQLEHDRLIRHLQGKYKRKFEVAMNLGDEQVAPVKIGTNTFFPDLVLTSGRTLAGVVEVESGESVNNLEAMAQWVNFSRARVPFHLYVPVLAYDAARRLCDANRATPAEIWTYRPALEGFDLVRMHVDAAAAAQGQRAAAASRGTRAKGEGRAPARKAAARPKSSRQPARAVKPARAKKTAKAGQKAARTAAKAGSRSKAKPSRARAKKR